MRKFYTSLMLLTMLMVSMVAKAQYTAVINSDPIEGYVAGQQSFDPADIVSALGLEDFSALKTMVDAGGALYLKVGEEKSNAYTGNTNEWWMNLEGAPQNYSDAGTSWFVGLECEAAGDDTEAGTSWPDRINVYVGQMPGVFAKIYEASELKATIYLVNGDKEVSFDVTQNVTAAVKANVPDATTAINALTIVKDYELTLPFVVGKSYENKDASVTLADVYTALGVEDVESYEAAIADFSFVQGGTSTETAENSGEYIFTPAENLQLASATDGWIGRYTSYDESSGTETTLPMNYAKGWSGGCTFYLQGFALANGEYSLKTGQYPGTLQAGDTDWTYLYLIYGDKAARIKVQVEVTKPESVDPNQMVKVEEELTLNITQEPLASGYATKQYTFDVAKVAELLGCEVSDIDSWKEWASAVGGDMVDYSDTNDGYIGANGFPMTWSDGAIVYIQPVTLSEGTFLIGQRGGYGAIAEATVENPLEIPVQLLFTYGQNYVVLNINLTIAPDGTEAGDPDNEFGEIVATLPITFEMKPSGSYYGDMDDEGKAEMELDLNIESIKTLLGEGTYNVFGLLAPASAEAQPKLTEGTGYGPNSGFNSGFWMGMPKESLGDEYVNTSFVGTWGTNAYGIEWKLNDGIFGFDQIPNQRSVGDTYTSTFYWALADKSKAIKYELTVKYVEEPNNSGNSATIVDNINRMMTMDELEAFDVQAFVKEAFEIDDETAESVVPKLANSPATYISLEDGDSYLMKDGAIFDLKDGEVAPADCYTVYYEDNAFELDAMEIPFTDGDESNALIRMAFDYTDAEGNTSRVLLNITVVSKESPLLNVNGISAGKAGKAVYYTLSGAAVKAPAKGLYLKKQGAKTETIYVK